MIDEARIALANADGSCSSSELVRRVARAKVHLRAAQAHVRAKRYAYARDEYLLALKQDRSYAPALAGLGQLPLPSIPKDPAWWSVALEALVAAAAAITAVAADLALGVLLLVLVMAGVWFLLGVACRHSARMRAIARRVGLTRISKEHVRLVEVPPLDRDGEQIVRLIHRQLELGLIPASNPSELILDPLTALDQPIASSDLLSDVLSAMGP
ncbi:MAG TPA: hypothetical protein VFZ00_09735, partial [Solirubrobacter sp.]|nr:hypothetical protein [Solirubrobacter sp.]